MTRHKIKSVNIIIIYHQITVSCNYHLCNVLTLLQVNMVISPCMLMAGDMVFRVYYHVFHKLYIHQLARRTVR